MPEIRPRRLGGDALHGERGTDAPLAAHTDAVNSAQNQEDGVVWREAAQEFDDGKEHYIRHQRTASAVTIGQHAENHGADRTHGESSGRRKNDLGSRHMKLCS